MHKLIERIQFRITVTNWSVLPAPVWAVVASPLLTWAGIGNPSGRWVNWPKGCSRSPFNRSFWCVEHAFTRSDGSLWYRSNGQSRRFKPSNFNNPVTSMLNRSLVALSQPGTRELKLWERVLLGLGF